LTSLRLLKAALVRDLLFFTRARWPLALRAGFAVRAAMRRSARAKKSRQKKALFLDKSIMPLSCYQDFSIHRPWRIEKRRASCPPPDGSAKTAIIHRYEDQGL
jgi:hypothetical protein